MSRRSILLATLAGLFLVTPAFGQSVARLSPVVQIPKGVPGFFDRKTGTFTPLDAMAPSAAGAPEASGTFDIHIKFDFLRKYRTVFCSVQLEFGNLAGSPPQFFTNHFATASDNFSAAEPIEVLPIPYNYTPSGNGTPKMRIDVTCYGIDDAGVRHQAEEFGPAMDIPSGNPSYTAFEDFLTRAGRARPLLRGTISHRSAADWTYMRK